jgi:hypothetical protein
LQVEAHILLRDPNREHFKERLEQIHQTLGNEIQRNPNGVLFALIQLSAFETEMYSATHAMLVSVMCGIAAGEVLNWPEPVVTLLRKAALTMNVSMTELQDRLTSQKRQDCNRARRMKPRWPKLRPTRRARLQSCNRSGLTTQPGWKPSQRTTHSRRAVYAARHPRNDWLA